MRIALIILISIASLTPTTIHAEEQTNLWILSGQSNACGRAKLPGPKADLRAQHFNPVTMEFAPAQDPLPGMGTTGVGPWVAAAQHVAKAGVEVKTVGFASGGKPISYWHPGQPGHKGLMPRITKAGQLAGVFLWYQGEANTGKPNEVATYKAELKKLVAAVRKQANNPGVTAVIVQLGAFTRGERDFMGLREAQRQFVYEDGNALLVPALGRPLKDAVHLNNAGYQELGRDIGRALLRVKYKQPDVNWPGPVMEQAVLAANAKTIVAHFAEVTNVGGVLAKDFAAIDSEGTAICTKAEAGSTNITLTFDCKITPPAKLIYAHGNNPKASLVDEAGNRAPAVQLNLTTGSAPTDKPTTAPNGAMGTVLDPSL